MGSWISPKVIAVIVVLALLGFLGYKVQQHFAMVEATKAELVLEKKNVETLRANEVIAKQVNEDNQKAIDQLQIEKNEMLKASAALRVTINQTNRKLDDSRRKMAAITVPPVPLTPYLVQAVEAIQDIRNQKVPTVTIEAPKPAASAPAATPPAIKKVKI